MDIRRAVRNVIAAGSLFFALSSPKEASARDITLTYDYFENRRNTVRVEDIVSDKQAYSQGTGLVVNSTGYSDFLQKANSLQLSKDGKISLVAVLGDVAGVNYDFSLPFKSVSPQRIFFGVQNYLKTEVRTPSGAICGGIHEFMKDAAQAIGLNAVTYSGRNDFEGEGHVFASALGDDGFVNLSYGEMMRTGTFNFYQSLVLAQRAQGSIALDHHVHDGGRFKFRYITPDAKHLFRFVRFEPSLDAMVDSFERGIIVDNGLQLHVGNIELSAAYEREIRGDVAAFSFLLKGGRMHGQEPSALRHVDLFEGVARFTCRYDRNFFDLRLGAVGGLFDQRGNNTNRVFVFFEVQGGAHVPVTKDLTIGFGHRVLAGLDLDGLGEEVGSQMLGLVDGYLVGSVEYKAFSVYSALQGIGGRNNVQEQRPTFHLGDTEFGATYQFDFGKVRVAGRIQPEAYVVRCGFEHKYFLVDARYGFGRHGVFTPDFVEARAAGKLPLSDVFGKGKVADALSAEAGLSYRLEQWSHGEKNSSGTGQVVLMADF